MVTLPIPNATYGRKNPACFVCRFLFSCMAMLESFYHLVNGNQHSSFISSFPKVDQCIIIFLLLHELDKLVYTKTAFIKKILMNHMESKEEVNSPDSGRSWNFHKGKFHPSAITMAQLPTSLSFKFQNLEENSTDTASIFLRLRQNRPLIWAPSFRGHCRSQNLEKKKLSREHIKVQLVTQLCMTLCDPMDYSPPGSSVHGILQVRILE